MALLTIPSITKGTVATVSLNKTDLFALAAVTADSYFSDATNVKRCVVELNSDPGNQRKVLQFDLSQASPTASLLISLTGRDSFLLERLVLEDYDGGVIVLERSQLPSGLDVSIGGGGGGSITWTSDISASDYLGTATSIKKLSASSWTNFNVVSSETKSGPVSVSFTLSSEWSSLDWIGSIGLQDGPANSANRAFTNTTDYIWFFASTGYITQVFPIKRGENIDFVSPSYTKASVIGDVFSVEAEGDVVRWKKNGVTVRTLTGQSLAPSYRAGVVLYHQNSEFKDIEFQTL